MMLLKLIRTENIVKIAPFVFLFFGPNVWQKKNEKNDFKKSVICSGQAYLSHCTFV